MQTKEIANLPVHEEITFFQPLLESTRKLLDALEGENDRETEELDCFYAPTKGKKRPWKDIYLVREEWQLFRQYLMGKAPLLYFWEPPMRGLVFKESAFWVFSRPEFLKSLSTREEFRLNEFTAQNIKKLPFQNIEHHFQKELAGILADKEKVFSLRAQECEKYLKLAAVYLPKKQATEVHQLVRVLLKVGLQREIIDLIRILDEKVMVDPSLLKKRMRAVHTLAMKYYFAKASDEQKGRIDSLVGRDKGNQATALNYIERIMARSFKASIRRAK